MVLRVRDTGQPGAGLVHPDLRARPRQRELGEDRQQDLGAAHRLRMVHVVDTGRGLLGERRPEQRTPQRRHVDHRMAGVAADRSGRQVPQQGHQSGNRPPVPRPVDDVRAQDGPAGREDVLFRGGPGQADGRGGGRFGHSGEQRSEGAPAVDGRGAELDDPADAAAYGLVDQGPGAEVVDGPGRLFAGADVRGAVDHRVDALAAAAQRPGIGEIPVHRLEVRSVGRRGRGVGLGAVCHQPEADAGGRAGGGGHPAADEAGGPGDEDARGHERRLRASLRPV